MAVRYAQWVFAAAGVFNIAVGAAVFLAPATALRLLGTPAPAPPLFTDMTGWLVLVLGVGYCLTARNPARNRDLMLIGTIGKLLVLPLTLAAWRRGDVAFTAVGAGAGDLVFALLFVDVMRRMTQARAWSA